MWPKTLNPNAQVFRNQIKVEIGLIGSVQADEIMGDMMWSFSRIVYVERLSGSAPPVYHASNRLFLVAAGETLKSRVEAAGERGTRPTTHWGSRTRTVRSVWAGLCNGHMGRRNGRRVALRTRQAGYFEPRRPD